MFIHEANNEHQLGPWKSGCSHSVWHGNKLSLNIVFEQNGARIHGPKLGHNWCCTRSRYNFNGEIKLLLWIIINCTRIMATILVRLGKSAFPGAESSDNCSIINGTRTIIDKLVPVLQPNRFGGNSIINCLQPAHNRLQTNQWVSSVTPVSMRIVLSPAESG